MFVIYAGAAVNKKDGIGQTVLTVALHKDHVNTAKYLIESGASVDEEFYKTTISPLDIAK